MRTGSKYKPGDKWYAGPYCNGYDKGDIVEIQAVIGRGRRKKLCVEDVHQNRSIVSFKTLWKKCK